MEKIIWVDLDEVLAELIDYVLDYHNYTLNWRILKKEHIKNYYISKLDNMYVTIEEAINWFHKAIEADENNFTIKPVAWVYDILKKYKDKWYIFKIVTSRNWDLFWDYTKKWV